MNYTESKSDGWQKNSDALIQDEIKKRRIISVGAAAAIALLIAETFVAAQTPSPDTETKVAENVRRAPGAASTEKKTVSAARTSSEALDVVPARSTLTTRIGVQAGDPLTLSLDDAIRRALENNNDIEIARDDVRFQEMQIRSLRGAFDPIFTVTPTYNRNSITGQRATSDFNVNSGFRSYCGQPAAITICFSTTDERKMRFPKHRSATVR